MLETTRILRAASLAAILGPISLAGCGAPRAPEPVVLFHQGRYPEALACQEQRIYETGYPEQDEVLETLRLGMIAFEMGEFARADVLFESAIRDIGDFGRVVGEDEALSPFGTEDSKSFKGHPYERMAVQIFYGIGRHRKGTAEDARTALAAFESAILEDHAPELEVAAREDEEALSALESDPEMFRADSVFAHYMVAQARARIGDPDAEILAALDVARRTSDRLARAAGRDPLPREALDLERVKSSNLLVVVGMKREPVKVREGSHGELCRIYPGPETPEAYATVHVDGREVGRALLMEDFLWQAQTRGGREMDAILEGKAALKDTTNTVGHVLVQAGRSVEQGVGQVVPFLGTAISAVGLGFLAVSALTTPDADVRAWGMIPGQLHVLAARVEPGRHEISIRFHAADGSELPGLRQTWRNMDVPQAGQSLYYFRGAGVMAGDHAAYPRSWPPAAPVASSAGRQAGSGS